MSRVIGANSILNAVFMVAAALLAAVALQKGVTIPQLLLATGILNLLVAIYIYSLVPEFLLRFLSWLLVHFIYRLDKRGLEHIPDEGPALLICNHVSFADAIVISAGCRRPIRFIMESSIFKIPVLEHDLPRHEGDSRRAGARAARKCTSARSRRSRVSCATVSSSASFRKGA